MHPFRNSSSSNQQSSSDVGFNVHGSTRIHGLSKGDRIGLSSGLNDYERDQLESTLSDKLVECQSYEASKEFETKAVRKLDLTIIPIVAMFYLLSFLDRSNLGNARVAGLQNTLGITDHQYSVALTVTYIPYIAAEMPANLLLKKIGPNIFLPTIVTLWGLITTMEGFVKSYGGLIAARFFLGLVEGGMFPALVLYLSSFYTRHELQLRIALFFSAASLSGAFSGLLAFALIRLDGKAGLAGWSWIFIVEGLFTILWGLLSFYIFPGAVETHRFLTPDQKT